MMSSSSFKCGCVVDFDFVGWNSTLRNVEIDYCPMHSAVDALFEALCFAKSAIKSGEPWTDSCEEIIQAALALANGDPE